MSPRRTTTHATAFLAKRRVPALSARWYLGKDNVTLETVATTSATLGSSEFEKLRSTDIPFWMQEAFAGAVREPAHG